MSEKQTIEKIKEIPLEFVADRIDKLEAQVKALLLKLHGHQVYRRRSGHIACKECFTTGTEKGIETHEDGCLLAQFGDTLLESESEG